MTPHVAAEHPSVPASDHGAGSIGDGFAHAGIIGALLEALNTPEITQASETFNAWAQTNCPR